MERGAWWATVCRLAKSRAQLKDSMSKTIVKDLVQATYRSLIHRNYSEKQAREVTLKEVPITSPCLKSFPIFLQNMFL